MSEPRLLLGHPISMKQNTDGGNIIAVYDADAGIAGLHADVPESVPTLVTGSYASGTVIAATQEIANFFNTAGGVGIVTGFDLLDEEAQNGAMTVIFLDADVSIGNEHSAYSISDANAEHMLGRIDIAAADYKTYGLSGFSRIIYKIYDTQVVIPLTIKAASGTRSLYYGIVNGSGTLIWTGNKLKIKVPALYP